MSEPSRIGDDLGLGLTVPDSGPVDDSGRRRVNPVTPIVHGVSFLPFAVLFAVASGGGVLVQFGLGGFAAAVLLILLLTVLVTAWSFLRWRNLTYWFDDDGDLRVDSGVLTRKERRLQLSRLQAVDVAQPLFARIFSMAELTVEVAGSGDSRVKLQFLTLAEARALRNEVLARAAGISSDAGEAPETVLATVTPRDLAVSLLVRSSTVGLLLLSVVILVGTVMTQGWAGLTIALVTGGVPILIVVSEFLRYFHFTVSDSPDGLRTRFGLLRTETRTVPPGRVQSIEFVEPLLWRRWSWVRVRVNIAGVGTAEGNKKVETLITPVAPRDEAIALVHRILPGLDLESLDWQSAPARARRRSPIQWRQLAVAWDPLVLATRRGRVTRRLAVIPHARTQSVRVTQGPWERALDLASLHVDTTPGPVKVTAPHLDASMAWQVAEQQATRAGQGRGTDTSTHWAAH